MSNLRLLVMVMLLGPGVAFAFGADAPTVESNSRTPSGEIDQADAERESSPSSETAPAGTTSTEESATVEEIAARARDSVVVVTYTGRDGKQKGVGTGFIISEDGLIATNLHVIGEARPITVRLADGKEYEVASIHATERSMDLAVIRIDAQNLPALELGDSDTLQQGQSVVAIGNPHGLKHSIVSGVVSGEREIEGRPMIQLAIPIEPGNSGGPLLDRQGRVHGILTLKSLVTDNLGFAIAINALKPLLEKPNPVPISRWLTIGTLDPQEWTPLFGARWRQRAGRILVDGVGQGFGGRSLCLSERNVPELPYEVAVTVRLDDEAGAAGLVLYSDGENKHYGFYPSNGRLRLSRFDGPLVFTWNVLAEKASPHYRPGEWNTLKVRLERDKILCFVNGHLLIESSDARYRSGQVGLAKFRQTKAEFKSFRVARKIPNHQPTEQLRQRITELVDDIAIRRPPKPELVDQLLPDAAASAIVLRQRARHLDQQAERLRQLAASVHQTSVRHQLAELLQQDEEEIDLLKAALLVARLDNDEIDVAAYLEEADRLVEGVRKMYTDGASEQTRLEALNQYLFQELGFHGSRTDYYSRSNSYLNEVIDDREGLPITLSVLYMELARRIGLNVVGVGLPGHFVTRYEPQEGDSQLIDVFDGGAPLTREQAAAKVLATNGRPLRDSHLEAVNKKGIIVRMLHNLMSITQDDADKEALLRYVETIIAIEGDRATKERWFRAVLCFQTDRLQEALADTQWLLEKQPEDIDLTRVRELHQVVVQQME